MKEVTEFLLWAFIPFIPWGLWLWVLAFKMEKQADLIREESGLIWAQVKLLELEREKNWQNHEGSSETTA